MDDNNFFCHTSVKLLSVSTLYEIQSRSLDNDIKASAEGKGFPQGDLEESRSQIYEPTNRTAYKVKSL